jgi:hypothetical protein
LEGKGGWIGIGRNGEVTAWKLTVELAFGFYGCRDKADGDVMRHFLVAMMEKKVKWEEWGDYLPLL